VDADGYAESELVASVAHELRTPVAGISSFARTLLERGRALTEEQRELMLTSIAADAERLGRLVDDLLTVARLDTGRLVLRPTVQALAPVVARAVETCRAATSREVVLDVADDVPEVAVDPDRVAQVVVNLVDNGVRHGAGTVRVGVRSGPADGALLVVTDEGPGVPPEQRDRVFDRHWTGPSSSGSGLGLHLVAAIVRAHGGAVAVDAAPGGGARFTVTWPAP